MELKEDQIFVFKITGTKYNAEAQSVEYELSKEYIAIDKGRAIYWKGFTNHYVLLGFMRTIFSPEGRADVLQTAYNFGDYFPIDHSRYMVVWTGLWEPLERIGMASVTFQTSVFEMMINEVYMSMKENGGKLLDRN